MKAWILFGHGARNPQWAEPFHRIREAMLAREPGLAVELGFLELMRPTLDESIDCLVGRGATRITIVPVFMAPGRHVQKDLPQLAANAMDRHPGLEIGISPCVGEASTVIGAMAAFALTA